jgi:hypothetical protein
VRMAGWTQGRKQLPSILALPHHEPFHETPEQRWQWWH